MKYNKIIIICAITFFAAFATHAQQIAVVSPGGVTTTYTDLNRAIFGAEPGSSLYLSGGGFQISDTSRIRKKLSIFGIGHQVGNDNADGNTMVGGNFFFEGGSDGSSLMGIHLTGNVTVGTTANAVHNFLMRFCNVNVVTVALNINCRGVTINQNYIRGDFNGGNSPITVSNNIMWNIISITGGIVEHNVTRNGINATNSQVRNNIIFGSISGANTLFTNNMVVGQTSLPNRLGENCFQSLWADAFDETVFNVAPTSNYKLKENSVGKGTASNGTDIGIYGGTGFNDKGLPPIPRIVSKKIADQTDDEGKLRVEIEVSVE